MWTDSESESRWAFKEEPGIVVGNWQALQEDAGMMKAIKINREKLLAKVKENRAKHHEIFEEALKGYKEAVVEELEEMLEEAQAGKRISHRIELVQPVDQTREYDRIVTALEMTEEPVMELNESEFKNFVMDDWHWTEQFCASNAPYSEAATAYSVSKGFE
jgi:hypothetical protein